MGERDSWVEHAKLVRFSDGGEPLAAEGFSKGFDHYEFLATGRGIYARVLETDDFGDGPEGPVIGPSEETVYFQAVPRLSTEDAEKRLTSLINVIRAVGDLPPGNWKVIHSWKV
jgi:hypothetical protein